MPGTEARFAAAWARDRATPLPSRAAEQNAMARLLQRSRPSASSNIAEQHRKENQHA